MKFCTIIAIALSALIVGCGRQEPEVSVEPTAPDAVTPLPAPAPATAAAPAPARPPAAPPTTGDSNLDRIQAHVAWLERYGRIADARDYCRKARELESNGALVNKIRLLERREAKLLHSVAVAEQALKLVGTHKHDKYKQDIARRQLDRIEGDLPTMLRSAVSSGADDVAAPALELLIKRKDPHVGEVSALRFIHYPDSSMLAACAAQVAGTIDTLDIGLVPPLYRAAVSYGSAAAARQVRQAFTMSVSRGLPRNKVRDVFAMTTSEDPVESADAVLFMAFVYHAQARRDGEALDGLVQEKGATESLRRRIADEQARRSGSGQAGAASDWVAQAAELMAKGDYFALDDGLLGSWGKGDGTGFRVESDGLPQHLKPGPEAAALDDGSYSLTIRFKPDALPKGNASQPFQGLIKKEGWLFGSLLNADGRVRHLHLLANGKHVTVTSKTRARPGRWHHVGVTLNRATGTLSLFVDGKREDQASFEPGTPTAGGEDLSLRAFAALGVRIKTDAGLAFTGLVDNALVYARPLSAKEIASLAHKGT